MLAVRPPAASSKPGAALSLSLPVPFRLSFSLSITLAAALYHKTPYTRRLSVLLAPNIYNQRRLAKNAATGADARYLGLLSVFFFVFFSLLFGPSNFTAKSGPGTPSSRVSQSRADGQLTRVDTKRKVNIEKDNHKQRFTRLVNEPLLVRPLVI